MEAVVEGGHVYAVALDGAEQYLYVTGLYTIQVANFSTQTLAGPGGIFVVKMSVSDGAVSWVQG